MLLLAYEALDGEIEVATVNHGLRPEAKAECDLVASQCQTLGVRCEVLQVTVAEGNLQEQARLARYAALLEWAGRRKLHGLATAHHADDQAETVLMRLNRGAGLQGLRGIRKKILFEDQSTPVVRPLLGFRRAELLRIVEQCGVEFVRDPSNVDERFDRVRMRQALADADWLDPHAIVRSANYLAEAERTLDSLAKMMWERNASVGADQVTVPLTNFLDTNARLVVRSARALDLELVLGEVMMLMKTRLVSTGDKANLGGALIEKRHDDYLVRREPPRRTG